MFDTTILYNSGSGPVLQNVIISAVSATIQSQLTINGAVWMPSGKKILNQSGGVVYLQNARILGGNKSESVKWDDDLNVNGEIKAGAGGISWFTSDVRIDGDLDVWGKKNAVVQTSKGKVRLSAIESPEVWFMDMIDSEIDPLFEEVCEGDFHYLPVYSGKDSAEPCGWLVVGKRRGFADRRFDKA